MPFGHKAGLPPSKKYLLMRQPRYVPKMHTRAKMKIVASDRARRENVPRHILLYNCFDSKNR